MSSESYLIIAASIGSGHSKAAEAVAEELRRQQPGASVNVVDFTDWRVSPATAFMKAAYLFMLRFIPNLYELLFRLSSGKTGGTGIQGLISAVTSRDIGALLRRYRPTAIVCTHPFPAGATAWRRAHHPDERYVFATVITDYTLHRMWVCEGVDLYFVAQPAMRDGLVAAGQPECGVVVSGIPIAPAFCQLTASHTAIRGALGFSRAQPIVLVMGGGLGLGGMDFALAELEKIDRPLQIVVVAGKNEHLRDSANKFALRSRHAIVVLGFSSNVNELMSVATLLLSKPGALTIAEALAVRLPMLLHEPIPGPETANARCIAAEGAALWLSHDERLSATVQELLDEPRRLAAMRAQAERLRRPEAAAVIVERLRLRLASP